MMKLAMVLRFEGFSFVIGLVMLVVCGFGYYAYEPLPESLPFTTPIPYDWLFIVGGLFGAVIAVRAWRKGSALAS